MEDIKVEFEPLDGGLFELVETEFADDEVFESNAFSGAELIIILLAARDTVFKALRFYNSRRESFKGASITFGKDTFSITGYTMDEINNFIKSGNAEKVIDAIKKNDA